MNIRRKHLIWLIENGDFKEARRFIRTLHHPKQDELLRRVDIAEEKHLQRTASRQDNLDVIEELLEKGHFEKARRFVYALNHPKKTELLLKIEDKRQTDTMKAIVIGRKIENEPTHPHDILESRPLGILGMPISFILGLRMVEMLRNYKRMGRTGTMWLVTTLYITLFCIFVGSIGFIALRAMTHAASPIEFALVPLVTLLLALSPYLVGFTQTRTYDHWYHDFKTM